MNKPWAVTGVICGLGCIPSWWVCAPISTRTFGFAYPLVGSIEHLGAFLPGSYGALAGILTLLAALSFYLRWPRALAGFGFALLALTLFAVLQLAYIDPLRLRLLMAEHDEYRKVASFTSVDLPLNRGIEPLFEQNIDLLTVWDRFWAALTMIYYGWMLAGTAGLAFIFAALPAFSVAGRWRFGRLAGLGLGGMSIGAAASPLIGEYYFHRALQADIRGDIPTALVRYERCLAFDRWYQLGPYLYRLIGALHERTGETDSGEYHLYRGYSWEIANNIPDALDEYHRAARAPRLAIVGLQEAGRLEASTAGGFYAAGAIGEAAAYWEKAVRDDPRQLFALFALGRSYYQLAYYEDAVAADAAFLKRCHNHLVLANVHSNTADAQAKLGNADEARRHYTISQKLDDDRNFRAYNSLSGQK
jgi:tetratricopeptide (TPR) repeat protein